MHILIAIDDSSTSQAAIEFVKRFPFPPATEVTLLTVLTKFDPTTVKRESIQRELAERAERLLAQAFERLDTTGWTSQMRTREGHAAEQIVQACREVGADLVVIGSHGHGALHRFLLGSVSQKVMKYAACSALIVRSAEQGAGSEPLPDSTLRILAGFDQSETANAAIRWLSSLPLGERAKVRLMTVLELVMVFRMDILQTQSPEWQTKIRQAKEALDKAAERLRQATPNVTTQLREGRDKGEEILKAASDFDAHLVVVGATGRSGIEKFLLGSVSNRIAHHASSPVLVVRPPGRVGPEKA